MSFIFSYYGWCSATLQVIYSFPFSFWVRWEGLDQILVVLLLLMKLSHWKQDRGFLPLSAALLSTTILHSEAEDVVDISMEIVSSIGSIILSLLFCRSGFVNYSASR